MCFLPKSLFSCVLSICSAFHYSFALRFDEDVLLICWCFFYLHVFSEVAARWALSASVDNTAEPMTRAVTRTEVSLYVWLLPTRPWLWHQIHFWAKKKKKKLCWRFWRAAKQSQYAVAIRVHPPSSLSTCGPRPSPSQKSVDTNWQLGQEQVTRGNRVWGICRRI